MKLKSEQKQEIYEDIYKYRSKYPEGLINEEINELKEKYSDYYDIDEKKFEEAFFGNTCMMRNEQVINYHCDVYKAFICGIENRGLTVEEWD